jgi:drug/metabolite transporter (DMT)-like permease
MMDAGPWVVARAFGRVPERLRYYGLLHLVVLIWGFTGIIGRLISLESVPLVFYRVTIAVPFIGAYVWWGGGRMRVNQTSLLRFAGVGVLVACHWTLFFQSIKMSTVSAALVCQSTAPFFTALLEPLAFARRPRVHELLLGVAAAAGVAVIFGFETEHAAGIAVGLAAAFVGAVFTVINGRLVTRYDSRVMAFYELASAWVAMSVFLLLIVRPFGAIPVPGPADFAYLVILGTVCTAFAFIGGTYVMRRLSPFTVMLTTNLEPVYGIVLALIVFGEAELMSAGFYAGAALILASIWVNVIIVRRVTTPEGAGPHGERPAHHNDAA